MYIHFTLTTFNIVPFAEVNIEKFEDPFKHIRSQQFDGDDQQLTPTAKNLVNVLDSNQGAYDNIQDKVMNAIKGANSPKDIKKMLQLGAGPGKEISSIDDVQNMFSGLGDVDINSMWAMVEFGRCPDADYSTPIPVRVRENIKKANYILADMRAQGIEPDAYTFTSYLTVYANGGYDKDALQIFKDTFNENTGLQPHYRTYRSLIQMSLRKKNLNQAIELKNEMIRAGIQPDSEIHGIFIETYAQRKMVVEGLKELEEATVKGLKIPERLIRHLRSQCRNMQVKHPDMPADPKEWVRDIKKSRRDLRNVSKRDIQQLKSLYTKVA